MSQHDPTLPHDPDRTEAAGGLRPSAAAARDLPAQIGRYRPVRILGQGGMGVVYEAEQQEPRRRVALKVIRPELATADLRRRFAHESVFLARLQHPGIAQVYEAGTAETDAGSVPFIAMELVDGVPLTTWVLRAQPDLAARLAMMIELCDAVQHAHQRGLIHRDLKPANILVGADGRPRILDFGVARPADADLQTSLVTTHGELVGTLAYMSPEQLAGDPNDLDTRSDVYAMGVILYELLACQAPLELAGRPLPEALRAIRDDDPRPLSSHDPRLAGDLTVIAATAMAKDRDQRYASANELATDLRRYLDDEPIAARPPSTVYLLRKFARRHRPLVIGVVGMAAALVLGVVASTWQAVRATRAEQLAATRLAESEAVTGFLQGMLAAIQPEEAQGRDVTVREVLDRASVDLAGGSLADRPQVEAALRNTLGTTYRSLGEFDASERQLRRGLALADSLLDPHDPSRLNLELDLARTLSSRGEIDEAESLARSVLARAAPRSLLSASALGALAVSRYERGFWQEADSLQLAAQMVLAEAAGGDSLALAETLLARAFLAEQLRRLDRAQALTGRAVAILRDAHGDRDVRMIKALNRQGDVARLHGNHQEALRIYRDIVAIADAGYPSVHPARADALWRLGIGLNAAEEFDAARPYLEECLAIRREVLGPAHRDIALALGTLASAHLHAGRLDEAEACLQEALAMREGIFGSLHLSIASSLQDLGALERKRQRPAEAVAYFERSQAVLDQLPDAVTDLASLNAFLIAMTWQDQGDHAAAEPHFRRSLAVLQAAHPGPHDRVAKAMSNLATNFFRLGRKEEAAATQGEALAMVRALGVGGSNLWLALGNTAFMLDDAGRHDEAGPLHEELIAVASEAFGEDKMQTIDARSRWFDNLARRRAWTAASEQARLVEAWRREHLPADDLRRPVAGAMLAEALAGLGRLAEADSVLTAAETKAETQASLTDQARQRLQRVRAELQTRLASR
jgi:tetratricopeptide (TPR) repeat protein/predicted Ser/Thr protein kinase